MGLLRFILAISVVAAHCGPILGSTFVGGQYAVESFYIISGFYMSLILNEKYVKANSYRLFITNRFIRLFPIYWLIMVLTVAFSLGVYVVTKGQQSASLQPYITYHNSMGPGNFIFFIFTNIFIFFQDMVMFLGMNTGNGHLFFTPDFNSTKPLLYTFLFLPQAWTIGLELTFYLIAPFIVRKRPAVVLSIIAASVLLRLFLYSRGLHNDPWTYRFFPTELAFFLSGNIAYVIYKKIQNKTIPFIYIDAVLGVLLLSIFFFDHIPIPFKQYIYMLFVFLVLPFIFYRSKNWKFDNYIGELSYPIYISHMFILTLFTTLNIKLILDHGVLIAAVVVLFSIALNELLAKRIEKIRQQRVKKAQSRVN